MALQDAQVDLANARKRATRASERLASEETAETARQAALAATNDERRELRSSLAEIDAGLDATRVERVLAFAHGQVAPFYLLEALGQMPPSRGGQQAWCGIAVEIERHRDRHGITNEFMAIDPEPTLRHASPVPSCRPVRDLVANANEIVYTAQRLDPEMRDRFGATDTDAWASRVDQALRFMEAMRDVATPEAARTAEPDIGLGW